MDYGDAVLPERYWDKVYPCPLTGCWLWGGAEHDKLPYGLWRVERRTHRAHVSAFVAAGGIVTADRPHVLHSCDQPSCVRPDHLRAGTQADNVDDARQRGRLPVGTSSSLTAAQVVELRQRYADQTPVAVLAQDYDISPASVSLIARGLRWGSVGGPLTIGRHRPADHLPPPITECKYGHALTSDNVQLKPNRACRDGFERVCIKCRQRANKEQAARRKAARTLKRGRVAG